MRKYIEWNVPVYNEFVKLAYLSDEELLILDSWVKNKSVISQSIDYNLSESTVKNIRRNIIKKYQAVMKYSIILRDAWLK